MYFKKCMLSLLSFACFQVTIIHTAHDAALPDQSMSTEDAAATKIQAQMRRHLAQKKAMELQDEKDSDTAVDELIAQEEEKDEAATKIQAQVRRRQAQKKAKELQNEKNSDTAVDESVAKEEEKDAAATKIQAQARRRLAQKKFEQMKKEDAAATTLQKVGRGLFKRQQLSFDKILTKVPYEKFRDLICSGDFLDKTDWFYRYMEIDEKRQVFARNKTDKDGNKVIDVDNPELLTSNPKNDFDELFFKYMNPFLSYCFSTFKERAVHEITVNKMPWSEAVSIMQDDHPLYPLGNKNEYRIYVPRYERKMDVALSTIFARVYEKTMPPFPMVIKKHYGPKFSKLRDYSRHPLNPDDDIFQGIIFKAMGMEYKAPVKSGQTVQQTIEQNTDKALMYFLTEYFTSLGAPDDLDVDDPFYGLELEHKEPKREDYVNQTTGAYDIDTHNSDWNKWSQDKYRLEYYRQQELIKNTNWHLVAHQVFELGRLLFENKIDAFDKLGGQEWLDKQPAEIKLIIRNKVNSPEGKPQIKPTPAKQIKFFKSGYNPSAKQPVYA